MAFPKLELSDWKETKETVQRYAKVVSTIRATLSPPLTHGWQHALYATARGLTSSPLLHGDKTIDFEFDYFNHELQIRTNVGEEDVISLDGQSVKEFRDEVIEILGVFGLSPEINFTAAADDDTIRTYDDTAVENFWQALSRIDAYFKLFKATLPSQSSPVQIWPDGFNLYFIWLSGETVPGADPEKPALRDEQIYFGFSAGDHLLPEPYFYGAVHPQPDDLPSITLPDGARWQASGMNSAVLPYAAFREAADPQGMLHAFLDTLYKEGSRLLAESR